MTSARKPVKNKELWIQMDELAAQHNIEWHWVKGHSGHTENERVDDLANKGIDEFLAGKSQAGISRPGTA